MSYQQGSNDPNWAGPSQSDPYAQPGAYDPQVWLPTTSSETPQPPPPPIPANPYAASTDPYANYSPQAGNSSPVQDPYSNYGPMQGNSGQSWSPYPGNVAQTFNNPALKIQPARRRIIWPWVLLTLVVVLVLGCTGVGFVLYRVGTNLNSSVSNALQTQTAPFTTPTSSASGPTSVVVGAHPRLIIDENLGAINVRVGSTSNTITLQALDQNNNPINSPVHYARSGDGNTITVNLDVTLDASEIDVTVPGTIDLKLTTNADNINVTGVNGQMLLSSNGGVITLTQSTLTRSSVIDTNGGSITATGDTLNAQNGQISFKTNSDSITFKGKIASLGTYHFESNTGDLDVTLPGNSSFHVDVSTNTGTATTNFSGLQGAFSNLASSGEAHADVGHTPRPTITFKTNTGSINLNKGS